MHYLLITYLLVLSRKARVPWPP